MKPMKSITWVSGNRHFSTAPDKEKNACMRWALVFAAVIFCLASVTCPAWADCHTQHMNCVTDFGMGKDVGKVSVSQCWNWHHLRCEYCDGDKKPVKQCQSKYPDQC